MIPVTKTFLPPIAEYQALVQRAWNNNWLTNRGELVLELEQKLKAYLEVRNIIITNNGTVPLQIALKLLGDGGEIITTPFSYAASTAAIVWGNCIPVFADIHPEHLTIDESKIETAITSKTTAILATHVFGNPCNIEAIDAIAKRNNLKVIYDAAHCFGIKYQGQSIFTYGDISTCSFHATKLFHTAEGGAMFCQNDKLNHKLFYNHNAGNSGEPADGLGINAKISELQAAMGLAMFPYIDHVIKARKKIVTLYNDQIKIERTKKLKIRKGTEWNYSYYPIIFETEEQLLTIREKFHKENISPRRYFYPSLNTIEGTTGKPMPISEGIASRILCLPLYVGLEERDVERISRIINSQGL